MTTTRKKRCSRCRKSKSLDKFHNRSRSADGKTAHCKECHKEDCQKWRRNNPDKARSSRRKSTLKWIAKQGGNRAVHLRSKFGISQSEYDSMATLQGHVCKICQQPETKIARNGKLQPLSVDHDHQTGRVRGLLCCRCNRMLGFSQDSVSLLLAAVEYLRK